VNRTNRVLGLPRPTRTLTRQLLIALVQIPHSCTPLRAPEQPIDPSLRLMTYNLDKDSADRDAGIELIRQLDPDVICFQEASAEWQELIRSQLGDRYRHISFNTPQSGYDGMGIASKFDIEEDVWLSKSGGGWFPAQNVVLKSPLGRLQVLNVHLRPPSSDTGNKLTGYFTTPGVRRQEIEGLLGQLKPDLPTLVVGDFNEGDGGQAVGFMRHSGFTDALPEFDRNTSTWQGTYKRLHFTERADHVLYSAHLRCFEAKVIPERASDHDPVLVTIGPARGTK
jgi:endonuclease/exonuclease/phosphatase (EEP) superfamily protein YafD